MKSIKVLNGYAGIGGNRKLIPETIIIHGETYKIEITAVEINPKIAKIYQDFFPNDKVIVTDVHKYLLKHYKEYDFIWLSPPCPSHGRSRYWGSKTDKRTVIYPPPIYPDMALWQEIIFLEYFFKGKYVVENVVSYYKPLKEPQLFKSHYYWANFIIDGGKKNIDRKVWRSRIPELQKKSGFDLSKYKGIDKLTLLRNCVEPESGLYIFNCAFKIKQQTLNDHDGGINFTQNPCEDSVFSERKNPLIIAKSDKSSAEDLSSSVIDESLSGGLS